MTLAEQYSGDFSVDDDCQAYQNYQRVDFIVTLIEYDSE